nr:transposase [Hymenolepis microstoma]
MLGTPRVENQRRCGGTFACWKDKRERDFFIILLLETKMGTLSHNNPKRGRKSWGLPGGHAAKSTPRPNIHGSKVMLGGTSLVTPEPCSKKEKRPQYKERHDKVILQHGNTRPHEMGQSGEKISRNVEMDKFTSSAVLFRCCSISFLPHPHRSIAHDLARTKK